MAVDSSQVDELAHDFGLVPGRMVRKIKPIMNKTGLSVKRRMQKDFRGSTHFKQVAAAVDYDVKVDGDVIEVEVGPNAHRNPSAALAGIAYFGTSRPGGATVPDPIVPMRQEEPVLLGFLQMAVEDLL